AVELARRDLGDGADRVALEDDDASRAHREQRAGGSARDAPKTRDRHAGDDDPHEAAPRPREAADRAARTGALADEDRAVGLVERVVEGQLGARDRRAGVRLEGPERAGAIERDVGDETTGAEEQERLGPDGADGANAPWIERDALEAKILPHEAARST